MTEASQSHAMKCPICGRLTLNLNYCKRCVCRLNQSKPEKVKKQIYFSSANRMYEVPTGVSDEFLSNVKNLRLWVSSKERLQIELDYLFGGYKE